MRKIVLFIVAILFLSLSPLSGEEIFAPFVSGLKASVQDNTITLTWRQAPAALDSYIVYRSTTAIDSNSFAEAKSVGMVDSGITSFVDTPPQTLQYYYAVLGQNKSGKIYQLFIPYRNVLLEPVAVSTTESPDEAAAQITELAARLEDNSVVLNFSTSTSQRQIILYRSVYPLESKEDLLRATAVTTAESAQQELVDYPLPGVSYYYALFDAELAKAGTYKFSPGENILESPIRLPISASPQTSFERGTSIRLTPLPFLLLSNSVLSGDQLSGTYNIETKPAQLTAKTISLWNSIEEEKALYKEIQASPAPQLLQEESIQDLEGEAYRLAAIVRDEFSKDSYKSLDLDQLEKELSLFMSVRHSDELGARANFYLGQVYFFQGKYTDSFFKFLMAGDSHYTDIQTWLNHLFPKLET